MSSKIIDSKYRNTVVCVDSYKDSILVGRLYNPYVEGSIEFHGWMSFILATEDMLDQMNYPQAYEVKRTFTEAQTGRYKIGQTPIEYKGEVGTFEIKIFFRQNASWQGTIRWLEEEVEESFRSVLELSMLMNSALHEAR